MNKARLVHPGFWFGKTPLKEALTLAKRGVGGFCLYGGTKAEVAAFTAAVRAVSASDYLLISADYEDGLGRWLPDAPLLPSNMALGAAGEEDLAFEKGLLTARQARSLGVDWIFAPVADLATNPLNPIVNTRAFSANSAEVVRLAGAFMKGLAQGGALNSLKHFPGHGDTTTDSHLGLPVIRKTLEQLQSADLLPFKELLPQADSVMIGHLSLPLIDAQKPSSLSKKIIGSLLREQMNFQGCVVTDALLMKAIGDEKQAALDALEAGADILLVPQDPAGLIDFLERTSLPDAPLKRSEQAQNMLCARAQKTPVPSPQEAFAPNDFSLRTAQKAISKTGPDFTLTPGETVYYLEVANTSNISPKPFLNTLEQHGIKTLPFQGQEGPVMVLCFRRYQAFEGNIGLQEEEKRLLERVLKQAPRCACVLFASPWALGKPSGKNTTLYTFSPAPEFQQTAAEILLGLRQSKGKIPVSF